MLFNAKLLNIKDRNWFGMEPVYTTSNGTKTDMNTLSIIEMLNKTRTIIARSVAPLLMAAMIAPAVAYAEKQSTADNYADSVYNWGSWELGLEPAAGGPIALPNMALSNRPADIRFRPNDNSVFNPGNRVVAETTMAPTPVPPVVPPTYGPGTAPSGGPGDRF